MTLTHSIGFSPTTTFINEREKVFVNISAFVEKRKAETGDQEPIASIFSKPPPPKSVPPLGC